MKKITTLVLVALFATPAISYADTNATPTSPATVDRHSIVDKAKSENKAAIEKAKNDAKAAIEKAKNDAKTAMDKAKTEAKDVADKAKTAKENQAKLPKPTPSPLSTADQATLDAYKQALIADKAARQTIEKNFGAAIKSARDTFKTVRESKPDAATLQTAKDAFAAAVSAAEQAKKDAIAKLPALPAKPVFAKPERAEKPKFSPTTSPTPVASPSPTA